MIGLLCVGCRGCDCLYVPSTAREDQLPSTHPISGSVIDTDGASRSAWVAAFSLLTLVCVTSLHMQHARAPRPQHLSSCATATFLNFDGVTYGKGSAVVKQLAHLISLDKFREGIQLYFKRHAWGNTTIDDFLGALQEHCAGLELKVGGGGGGWLVVGCMPGVGLLLLLVCALVCACVRARVPVCARACACVCCRVWVAMLIVS